MMKRIIYLLIFSIFWSSCKDQELDCCVNPKPVNITLKFTHHWDETPVTSSDFNEFKFINENGESVRIEKLRYLVSNITIGNQKIDYHLVDLGENASLELSIDEIPKESTYYELELYFTFGFSNEDNLDGIYPDLNSVSFNVPAMLGGGYHYMQFDGKYKDTNNTDGNFNYHTIRAVDSTDPNNLIFEDTSFEVFFDSFIPKEENVTLEIKMNIAEWFKNPNTWNLNELNTALMPNFDAQKLMNENGKTVFSLGDIIQ